MARQRKHFVLGLFALAMAVLTVACGGRVSSETSPIEEQARADLSVRGLLSDVQPSSFFGLKSVTLTDADGKRWEFEGRDIAIPGFAASHLREHMILGLPVIVAFSNDNGVLVITAIKDATVEPP